MRVEVVQGAVTVESVYIRKLCDRVMKLSIYTKTKYPTISALSGQQVHLSPDEHSLHVNKEAKQYYTSVTIHDIENDWWMDTSSQNRYSVDVILIRDEERDGDEVFTEYYDE